VSAKQTTYSSLHMMAKQRMLSINELCSDCMQDDSFILYYLAQI
jgi:hypothetical protein